MGGKFAVADSQKSDLSVQSQDYADCRLVSVAGRVDHTNSDAFLAEISALADSVPAGGGMVIDLSRLEFITSAGLRALLLAQRSVKTSEASLFVSGVGGVVKEVFRISKFDALLSVFETTEEAIGKVSDAAAQAHAS